jgi:hypothetical protein
MTSSVACCGQQKAASTARNNPHTLQCIGHARGIAGRQATSEWSSKHAQPCHLLLAQCLCQPDALRRRHGGGDGHDYKFCRCGVAEHVARVSHVACKFGKTADQHEVKRMVCWVAHVPHKRVEQGVRSPEQTVRQPPALMLPSPSLPTRASSGMQQQRLAQPQYSSAARQPG